MLSYLSPLRCVDLSTTTFYQIFHDLLATSISSPLSRELSPRRDEKDDVTSRRVRSDATYLLCNVRPLSGPKPVYRLILREYTGFPTASGCRRKAVYFFSREYTGFVNTPLFTKPVYIRPFKVHWYTEIRVHWIQYSPYFPALYIGVLSAAASCRKSSVLA